jgi:hypothetical protein
MSIISYVCGTQSMFHDVLAIIFRVPLTVTVTPVQAEMVVVFVSGQGRRQRIILMGFCSP